MTAAVSRRAFLRGAAADDAKAMRPPGAIRSSFLSLCRDCDVCLDACPETIIRLDETRRPVVDFSSGACTFCGSCAEACPTGALAPELVYSWPWRPAISGACLSLNGVSCRSCQDACESTAIRFSVMTGGRAAPQLDQEACNGCGACSSVCPVGAISFNERSSEATA